MKCWEYCYVLAPQNEEPTIELNKLGREGWEICAHAPENKENYGVFYLKRELPPEGGAS